MTLSDLHSGSVPAVPMAHRLRIDPLEIEPATPVRRRVRSLLWLDDTLRFWDEKDCDGNGIQTILSYIVYTHWNQPGCGIADSWGRLFANKVWCFDWSPGIRSVPRPWCRRDRTFRMCWRWVDVSCKPLSGPLWPDLLRLTRTDANLYYPNHWK